jgi:hypothetical protein
MVGLELIGAMKAVQTSGHRLIYVMASSHVMARLVVWAGDILDVRSDTSLTVLTNSKTLRRLPDGPCPGREQGHGQASTAPKPCLPAHGRGQAPSPRSGAAASPPGLRPAMRRKTIREAVLFLLRSPVLPECSGSGDRNILVTYRTGLP